MTHAPGHYNLRGGTLAGFFADRKHDQKNVKKKVGSPLNGLENFTLYNQHAVSVIHGFHGLEFCSEGFQTWKQNTKFYYPNHLRNIPLISTPTILGEGHPKLKNLHRSEAGASVAHFCLNTRQFCNINSKENEVPLHPQPVSSSYI